MKDFQKKQAGVVQCLSICFVIGGGSVACTHICSFSIIVVLIRGVVWGWTSMSLSIKSVGSL